MWRTEKRWTTIAKEWLHRDQTRSRESQKTLWRNDTKFVSCLFTLLLMSPREDSLPLPLPRKRLSSLPDTFHALPLLSGSSHNKHGESLYKSIQFSCTPLFTRHPHEPFVTVGLGVPPRGLGLGASYFDMLGSKYCFQCAFFICCRKYQAHIKRTLPITSFALCFASNMLRGFRFRFA